jgi:hypothetical protein
LPSRRGGNGRNTSLLSSMVALPSKLRLRGDATTVSDGARRGN